MFKKILKLINFESITLLFLLFFLIMMVISSFKEDSIKFMEACLGVIIVLLAIIIRRIDKLKDRVIIG